MSRPTTADPELTSVPAGIAASLLATAILVVTLAPAGLPGEEPGPWCGFSLVCGTRATADAVVNVFLFLPLGMALRGWLRSSWLCVAGTILFSMAIETAQLFVPGRVSSIGDVVFDGLGGAIGVLIATKMGLWLDPPPRLRVRLALGALAVGLGAVVATGLLARVRVPSSSYYVQWTPTVRGEARYPGRVLYASLAGRRLGAGRVREADGIRRGVAEGDALTVRFVAAPPPRGAVPLVRIITGRGDEVAQVAVAGTDVVFNLRRNSRLLALDDPSIVFPGALRHAQPGSVATLRLWRDSDASYCLASSASRETRCGVGFTAGAGWRLLLGDDSMPARRRTALGLAWLVFLFLPAGFMAARAGLAARLGSVALVGLLVLPQLSGLLPTPVTQLAAGLLGIALGALSALILRRFVQPRKLSRCGTEASGASMAFTTTPRHRSMRAKAASKTSAFPP